MTPRDTRTGGVLEAMIVPVEMGGYKCRTQVAIGRRPNGRPHKIDAVAEKDGRRILVSLKWQQTGGTAEQKVPFEVMCIADALRDGYDAAYLVLGGAGWTLRDFYTGGQLTSYLPSAANVTVDTMERFIARANQGTL